MADLRILIHSNFIRLKCHKPIFYKNIKLYETCKIKLIYFHITNIYDLIKIIVAIITHYY